MEGYTDNSIFLPAAGIRCNGSLIASGSQGYYWLCTLDSDFPYYAWHLFFYSLSDMVTGSDYRCSGFSVRPVRFAE